MRIPKRQSCIVRKFGGQQLFGEHLIVCDEIAKSIKSIKSVKNVKNVQVLQPTYEDSEIIRLVNKIE